MARLPSLRPNLNVPGMGRESPNLAAELAAAPGLGAAKLANIKAEQILKLGELKAREELAKPNNAAFINKALTSVASIGKSMYEDYKAEVAKDQVSSADLEAAKANTETSKSLAGVRSYKQNQVNKLPGFENDTRQNIPADEVTPVAYRQMMTDSINSIAESITDPRTRSDWKRNRMLSLEGQMARVYLQSSIDRVSRISADEINNFQDALSNGNLGIAQHVLDTSKSLDENQIHDFGVKIKEAKTKQDGQAATDLVEGSILSDNKASMLQTLNHMVNDENSPLDVRTRRIYADKLRSAISAKDSNEGEATKAHKALVNQRINDTISALSAGHDISPQSIKDSITLAANSGQPDKVLAIERAHGVNLGIRSLANQPRAAQDTVLSQAATTDNPSELAIIDEVRKGIFRFRSSLMKDPIAASIKYGVSGVTPIDFSSPESFTASAKKRIGNATINGQKYGAFGLVSDTESLQLVNMLNSSKGIKEKLQTIQLISSSFGEDAGKVFGKMKIKESSSLIYAGSIFAKGREEDARMVLEGDALLKTQNLFNDKKLTTAVNDKLAGVYQFNEPERLSAVAAVKAYYAAASQGKGPVDSYDDNILDQAIQHTVGDTISSGDRKVLPPFLGADGAWMRNYYRHADPSAIEAKIGNVYNGAAKIPMADLLTELDNETYSLVYMSDNQYLVEDSRNPGHYLKGPDETRFVFSFDETIPLDFNVKKSPNSRRSHYAPGHYLKGPDETIPLDFNVKKSPNSRRSHYAPGAF